MKNHIYIFRTNYLKVSTPIKLSETISIFPGNYELSQEKDINFDISFQIDKYSYIFIEKDKSVDFNDLKIELNLIFALISFLLSNWIDIYPQESYYVCYDDNKRIVLEKGIIVPFKKFKNNKQSSRISQTKNSIRGNIQEMYKDFNNNPITNTIYSIIGQFLISKREDILLTKVIYAWNVIEHLAFSYWENTDKNMLVVLNEDKFNELIYNLDKKLEEYIINNIKQADIYMSKVNYNFYHQDYLKLLKKKLRDGIDNYSPIKYKIIRMFENEGLSITKQEYQIISIMNKVRNLIYHRTIEKVKIEKEIKRDLLDLLNEFLNFLEIIIWKYFKFINTYAMINNGLISFKVPIYSKNNLDVENYTEKIEILKKLERIRMKIEKFSNKPIQAYIKGEKKLFSTSITFNYKRDSYQAGLVIDNLPQEIPSYGNLIKLKAILDEFNITFNFRGLFNVGNFSEILIKKLNLN